MIILDTNIISALMHESAYARISDWLDRQPRISVWITAITVLEIEFGLAIMPAGQRRSGRKQSFGKLLHEKLQGRVLEFDELAARETAGLMAVRRRHGITIDLRDAMIAGTAIGHHATLATRNVRHFNDLPIPVVNPWSP